VFGKQSDDFEGIVLALIKARCPQAEHIDVRRRSSKGGKYLALTLTFTVYSQKQLEEIYQDLYDCEQVVMSL
jgi:putative lipoic acid-binding regulatory protein